MEKVDNSQLSMLLNIQTKIKNNITLENITEQTKNLTNDQKEKLEKLYEEQIKDLDFRINAYKEKIKKYINKKY